jgi:flagellar hook-basal body complex protein FliE
MNSIQNNLRQMDPDLGLIREDSISIRQPGVQAPAPGADPKGAGFFETLAKSMEEVNSDQVQADTAIKDLVAGRTKNIHETMLQVQKAELSLKTMMQVRNKILEAYKEIMRMQV